MPTAVIVDAIRTPIGRRNGTLKDVPPIDLAAHTLDALVQRNDLDPEIVEDVIMGCVMQVGDQAVNVGRNAVLAAGFPESVVGATVDRQCGSSQQAEHFAAQGVIAGAYDIVIAAGVESMTRVPMGESIKPGSLPFGPKVLSRYQERGGLVPQGISAELIAERWGFSRDELDAYSLRSHERAVRAIDEGRFAREIVPVDVSDSGGGSATLTVDETPRRDTSLEALAALTPAFLPEGKVTAGNSSQICDGAAAVLVASERAASRLGLEPRARFVSFGLAGVDPHRMLHGNPQACAAALARAGLDWDDMDVIEVNEAFASVALQFARDARLEERWEDINPNGGGISLGHPLGATGARITATLVNEVERRDARYGIATMCIGFGQAIACVLERV